jgi:hypothetical protein
MVLTPGRGAGAAGSVFHTGGEPGGICPGGWSREQVFGYSPDGGFPGPGSGAAGTGPDRGGIRRSGEQEPRGRQIRPLAEPQVRVGEAHGQPPQAEPGQALASPEEHTAGQALANPTKQTAGQELAHPAKQTAGQDLAVEVSPEDVRDSLKKA